MNTLDERRTLALLGGGENRIEAQHAKGKLTARERLTLLFDAGSFIEVDQFVTHRCDEFGMKEQAFPGDGVVTGFGKVAGRTVYAFAQDFTVLGGSLGEAHAKKIVKIQDAALKNRVPIVGLLDSGGARIQEGVNALMGFGEIFHRNTISSGVIPQISAIMGPCAGGAVYSPAITDFVFMVEKTSHMFITGPEVIRAVTGEDIDFESLGGAAVHAGKSGVAHFTAPDDADCIRQIRRLLGFLPQNNEMPPPRGLGQLPKDSAMAILESVIPESPNKAYDMLTVLRALVDNGELLEVQPSFARNILTCFARFDGRTAGIVANQPSAQAGCLDVDASDKAARFVRFCDTFNIPLVTLVDVPGFLPGTQQEHQGIIRHGAKLLYAYSEATVPKITIVTRKAYGGAYIAMCCKALGADAAYAWPNAEIAVMGAEGAVNVLFKKEIDNAQNPSTARREKIDAYRELFSGPYAAAQMGYIDGVIQPRESRTHIIAALESCAGKREALPKKRHGNIPL